MKIEEQISSGIIAAMKSKDKVRLECLRNVKKYIIEAKTAGSASDVTDEDCIKIISKLAKQGTDSAEIYKSQQREDLFEYEIAQVAVLKEFLPKQLTDVELTEAIKQIISQTGATSMAMMGKVMGIASKELAGKAEGKIISAKVKELLA